MAEDDLTIEDMVLATTDILKMLATSETQTVEEILAACQPEHVELIRRMSRFVCRCCQTYGTIETITVTPADVYECAACGSADLHPLPPDLETPK